MAKEILAIFGEVGHARRRVHLITVDLHSHFRPPARVGCPHSDLNSRPEEFSCLVVRHKGKTRLPRAGLQAGLGHCYYNSGLLPLEQTLHLFLIANIQVESERRRISVVAQPVLTM